MFEIKSLCNKSFKRKVKCDDTWYYVTQNQEKQSIRIKATQGKNIYFYDAMNNRLEYSSGDLKLIKNIFEKAHIDRFVLKFYHHNLLSTCDEDIIKKVINSTEKQAQEKKEKPS